MGKAIEGLGLNFEIINRVVQPNEITFSQWVHVSISILELKIKLV
jgi:hypothetical protein